MEPKKDDLQKRHKPMEDKREAEQVRQFRERKMHDMADQVQKRIDARKKKLTTKQ